MLPSCLSNKLRNDLDQIKSDSSGEVDVLKLLNMLQHYGLENGDYFLHDIKVYGDKGPKPKKINCFLILHKFLGKLDSLSQELQTDYSYELICMLISIYQYQMLSLKSSLDDLINICDHVRKDRADEREFYEQLFEESEDNYRQLNKEWTSRFSKMEKSYLESENHLKKEFSNKCQKYLDDISDLQYSSNANKQKIKDLEQRLKLAEKQNVYLCKENKRLQEQIIESEKKQFEHKLQINTKKDIVLNEINDLKKTNDSLKNDLIEVKERNDNLYDEINEIKKTYKLRQKKKRKSNQKKLFMTSETQTIGQITNPIVQSSNKNDIGVQVCEKNFVTNNNQLCSYCDSSPTTKCTKLQTILTWFDILRVNFQIFDHNYRNKIHDLNCAIRNQSNKLKEANRIIDRLKMTNKVQKSFLTHKDILLNEKTLEVTILEAEKMILQKQLEENQLKNNHSWIFNQNYFYSNSNK